MFLRNTRDFLPIKLGPPCSHQAVPEQPVANQLVVGRVGRELEIPQCWQEAKGYLMSVRIQYLSDCDRENVIF